MIQKLYHKLTASNSQHFQLKYMDETILTALEHLLEIDKVIK